MVDPFSAAAAALSVVDVALRTCSKLYELINDFRDVPQLSQRLQRTVQSIGSTLSDLNTFIAQYLSTARPIALPDSVNKEIIFIKEDLIALAGLLSNTKKVRWVLNRKKLADVQQSLERHQISLILAFQSFASQQGIISQEVILNVREDIKRHDEGAANTSKAILDSMRSQLQANIGLMSQTADTIVEQQQQLYTNVEGMHRSIENGKVMTLERLDAINSSLSHMPLCDGHIRSESVLSAPDEHILARVFRAELQRVIVPTVKECFDQFTAKSDSRLDTINNSIDEIAHQLEQGLHSNIRDVSKVSTQESSIAIDSAATLEDLKACETTALATTASPDCFAPSSRRISGRRIRHWRQSWVFRWAIGKCWITISTSQLRRRGSNVFYIGDTSFSQNSYHVTIDFLPAQSLVAVRGITLSVGRTQDQRGYSRIDPYMSTFAVVPSYADVMEFAENNDVEGLQSLFERGLAAPSDRDKYGMTPLMYAAWVGAADVCRLLLAEGSDPLAVTWFGWSSFDILTMKCFWGSREGFATIVRLLQAADKDALETDVSSEFGFKFSSGLVIAAGQDGIIEELGPSHYQLWLDRGELLKQLGIKLNSSSLGIFVLAVMKSVQKFPRESFAVMLSVLLKLSADINSVDIFGMQPLHNIMVYTPTEDISGNFTGLALALLQHGADPCALNSFWRSPFDYAEEYGWTVKWYEVLEEAGFDVREVEDEIAVRKWYLENPGHGFAESTAIDEDAVAAPSTEGLSRRRAIAGDRLDD